MTETVLKIRGMSCGHCTASVTRALKSLRGVSDVRVTLADGRAVIVHEAGSPSLDTMKEAVEGAGYEVVV